jgi:hypothetical protein
MVEQSGRFLTEHEKATRRMDNESFNRLQNVTAITWRRSEQSDDFSGTGFLCPVEKSTMFALNYLTAEDQSRHMPLRAYRAAVDPDGGNFRITGRSLILLDGYLTPVPGASGKVIDPHRNPSALYTLLRMHKVARKVTAGRDFAPPPEAMQMPRLLVAYDYCPTPFMSQALEQLTRRYRGWAADATVSQQDLRAAMLTQWKMLLREPGAHNNPTATYLLDARVASAPGLQVYYDFQGLLGVTVFNPARDMTCFQINNPASACLLEAGIDVDNPETSLEDVDYDRLLAVVSRIRETLGADSGYFDDEAIYQAILESKGPLAIRSRSVEEQLARLGESRIFAEMRARLPQPLDVVVTDSELRAACADTSSPLVVGGACRTQVLSLPSSNKDGFNFSIGNARFELWPKTEWSRNARTQGSGGSPRRGLAAAVR